MKIFGIGLNKTGTTTLGVCLQNLGYRHSSFSLELLEQVALGNFKPLIDVVERHDSFEDWPYPLIYEKLDTLFPGSRFILTRRSNAERWFASLEAHALRTHPSIGARTRTLTYGTPYPQLDQAAHLSRYHQHIQRVRQYFAGRPGDLLEVCWEEDSNWQTLCAFLGKPTPDFPFPHANKGCSGDEELKLQNIAQLDWYRNLQRL